MKFQTIFYDPKDFPADVVQLYAKMYDIGAENMRFRLEHGFIQPTCHNMETIYIACKDRAKFQPIIDSHSKFNLVFVDYVPDYRKHNWVKKTAELYAQGFKEPFQDAAVLKEKENAVQAIIIAEKDNIFIDQNPGEVLNEDVLLGPKRRRNKPCK